MSLAEAMLDIAEQMDKDALQSDTGDGVLVRLSLVNYAKQIRSAVKAAGTQPNNIASALVYHNPRSISLEDQHRTMVDQAREEFRKAKGKADIQEKGERMVELVGQDELYPILACMPVGARMVIGTQVYELRADNKLHFVERSKPVDVK